MKVLFLDCDGVINTIDNHILSNDNIELDIDGCIIDFVYYKPALIQNINALCDRYGLKVVLSSTWRKDHELSYMKQLFKYMGLSCQLIDYTTKENLKFNIENNDLRGIQIQKWLNENQVVDYLVIDDMHGAGAFQHSDRFIHLDNMVGFDYTAYKVVINKFDKLFGGLNGN